MAANENQGNCPSVTDSIGLPESGLFRMNGSRFAAEMVFRYGGVWISLLMIAALAGIVLGITIDWRWLVVGLMVVFILCPMALSFLYYMHGIRKECYINTVLHKVTPETDAIRITAYFKSAAEREDENDDDSKVKGEAEEVIREYEFPYAELRPYTVGSKSVTLRFKGKRKGFIWLPLEAYENPRDMAKVLEYIDSKTSVESKC